MLSSWSAAADALAGRVDLQWTLPAALAVLAHYLAEPTRWHLYLGRKGITQWRRLFQIFSFTAFVGYLLPAKLGLPLRIVLLQRQFGLGLVAVSTLLGLDAVIYYAGWAIAAAAALPWATAFDFRQWQAILIVGAALTAAAVLLALALRHPDIWPAAMRGRMHRLRGLVGEMLRGRNGVPERRVLAAAAAVAALDIAGQVLRHVALLAMVGHHLPLSAVFAATALSIFAGLISMMPMGLGGYDVVMILLLGLHGVPLPDALAVVLANRAANLAVSAIVGVPSGAAMGIGAFARGSLTRLASGESGRAPDTNAEQDRHGAR